jgi:hypothetical protein
MILEAHIESAAFRNEFGMPCTLEYFGTLTTTVPVDGKEERRGYHKYIMLASWYCNKANNIVIDVECPWIYRHPFVL